MNPRFSFSFRPLAVICTLILVTLSCARSLAENPFTLTQATRIAASDLTQEPSWFQELPSSQPTSTSALNRPTPTSEVEIRIPTPSDTPTLLYYAQSGDTLAVVAKRFGVPEDLVESNRPLAQTSFITPEQLLIVPNLIHTEMTSKQRLLPDSEAIYGPATAGFDVYSFVKQSGGYLSEFSQWLESTRMNSGDQLITRVALEHSINPRLLLALLEYQSGWVKGKPKNLDQLHYPLGYQDTQQKDLYRQLEWAAIQLNQGYYAWREGRLENLTFKDGTSLRLAPDLNAGTVALMFFFAQLDTKEDWYKALDTETGLPAMYNKWYGDPWMRAKIYEPLFAAGITQPALSLPFERNKLWAYTGGPHDAWEQEGAWAALDFAPGSLTFGCVRSDAWVLTSAPGVVTRSENGIVALDLDGDGKEETGWVLLYLHIASDGRVKKGTLLDRDEKIGHPSCEGGLATGTHLHIARKYNGEWISADGPLPFNLDGWIAHSAGQPYKGTLTRNDQTVTANTTSPSSANIIRDNDDL